MWLKLLLTLLLFCYFTDGFPKLQVIEKGLSDDTIMHSHIKYNKEEPKISSAEKSKEYWQNIANEILDKQRKRVPNTNIAKNVIMFLGDGMSIPTLAAARVYLAQTLNKTNGEELNLSFEEFPYAGLSKTYCIDRQVADSACSATAYLCGVKANFETIGVSGDVARKDCKASNNTEYYVDSILRHSQLAGKRTGVVTTTTITHASPAGTFGHTAYRGWENDASVIKDLGDPTVCPDLAHQLVHFDTGSKINVLLGGGYTHFIPKTQNDPFGLRGSRANEDLIESWKDNKSHTSHKHVSDRKGLLDIPADTEYVLGLFASKHIPYNLERDIEAVPSLEEMTEAAIKLLSNDDKGFFLFVEGGRIDHAHHQTSSRVALDETIEMHKAIEKALSLVDTSETLIVVTADHAHTLSVSGYPVRGNDILGYGGVSDKDGKPYITLSYANGPGYRKEDEQGRVVPTEEELAETFALYPALVPLSSETHGGDDVGIFSIGPFSHFLDSVVEQNFIPRVMMYASCVGEGLTACKDNNKH